MCIVIHCIATCAVYPKSQVAYVGNTVSIFCNTTRGIEWRKNGKILDKPLVFYENVVVLIDVTEKDTGTYSCQGHNSNNILHTAYSELLVGSKL